MRRKERERGDTGHTGDTGHADDFGGIGLGGMVLVMAVAALDRPREALRELFGLVRRLGRRVLGLASLPFRPVALAVWSRSADRRPTFEDHLRRAGEDRDPP